MFRKLFLVVAAAVGGIYLTSEEGKNARIALLQKKNTFEPIIKDLLRQAQDVLEGSKRISTNEIRVNIDMLINEAKNYLIDMDFDATISTIREAIAVASKKIRLASEEIDGSSKKTNKKKIVQKVSK